MNAPSHTTLNPAGRRFTYLNGILTANGVLLAGLLWTQIAGAPLGESAYAQTRTRYADPVKDGLGVPDAGRQRMELVDSMMKLRKSVDAFYVMLERGDVEVTVTNLSELRDE